MIFYYVILLAVNILAIVIFNGKINITAISIVPLVLMGLSIFQATYLHNHRSKKDFNTNNNSPLTEAEWEAMALCMRNAYLLSIPLYIPLIFFVLLWIKMLSLLLYLVGFSGGTIYYRIKHEDKLNARFAKEKEEFDVQKAKEELGKWK